MAKVKKKNCETCSNAVGSHYCTMLKDMEKAKYCLCKYYKFIPKQSKATPEKKKRVFSVLDDDKYTSDFMRFLNKGGGYSIRLSKVLPERL